MIFSYIKKFQFIFLILLFSHLSVFAESIDSTQKNEILLLNHSDVYLDSQDLNLTHIRNKNLFKPYKKTYINTGMLSTQIWIRFTLKNDSQKTIHKVLILTSPLLEYITLYREKDMDTPQYKGVCHMKEKHHTLFPYYTLTLTPQSHETYYVKVHSLLTPVDFTLKLHDHDSYDYADRFQQLIDILLIGFVLALMLYSFILYFYTKDKSYLYYSFYLFALIYQQFTYLGLTQIYMPLPFIAIDAKIPVFKVNLLVITAALFAMHFLKTRYLGKLHKIYQTFILLSLLEIALLSTSHFYNLYIVIFTGALFICFNLIAGVIAYKNGNKQARLFIVGFSIVCFSYFLIILDAIGLTSIMQDFQNILMFGTAFEALILSLAFADRYIILQKEKETVDTRILEESTYRTKLIKQEVVEKTQELNSALEGKELLLKEVHHRVKNNLQIILSIIRLQNDEIKDEKVTEKFTNLENRINAISKTYSMLLIKDELEKIDMKEYIDSLLQDIQETVEQSNQHIEIHTDISAMIPLKESVYIGLIINELVTNAYKYAFANKKGKITISLHKEGKEYLLILEDNGKGYSNTHKHTSLGLKLIHTLVYDQLEGSMETYSDGYTKNIIRFRL
jgi:two-component sensor histidine kinase